VYLYEGDRDFADLVNFMNGGYLEVEPGPIPTIEGYNDVQKRRRAKPRPKSITDWVNIPCDCFYTFINSKFAVDS
jgi:hypothetical protein